MDLSHVKLRKTVTKEATNKPVQLICDGSNYQQLMQETYLEAYIDSIRDLSFRSVFRPLSRSAAHALCRAHQQLQQQQQNFDWRTSASAPELISLASEIDSGRAELGGSGTVDRVFVRLSSRSPKDAPLEDPAFAAKLQQELDWVIKDEAGLPAYEKQAVNRKLCAVYRALTYSMACSSGQEAVDLLVRSDRIQGDLSEYANGSIDGVPFNIVVREFKHFDPDLEFRAFVAKGRITAITQYNQWAFFPRVLQNKVQIMSLIESEVREKVLPALTLQNVVLDLVLVPKEGAIDQWNKNRFEGLELKVIELNPLAEFAGTGLFSWENDREVLLGNCPFEFRMCEKTPSTANSEFFGGIVAKFLRETEETGH